MTRCERCGFWYEDEHELYPRCHYEGPDAWAPCSQDEDEPEECWIDGEQW